MALNNKKLFIVVNVDWFFLSHRLPIALEALNRAYDVTIFAIEEDGKGDEIRSYGLNFIALPTSRSGTNIFRELKVLFFLLKHYRKGKPDIVHHIAVKPVTYGSIAAKIARVPRVINALSGLGFLFINAAQNKLIYHLVQSLFRFGFRNPNLSFILQNQDDLQMIKKLKLLKEKQIYLIKGSGVNLDEYAFNKEKFTQKLIVLLPARMLWDKGVGEFVKAAKLLHQKYSKNVEFVLAGGVDMGNKAGIDQEQLESWNLEGIVKWIGFQENMIELLQEANIVVLPSYREGLPKSLIEACAIGRAIITTDVPGCREVVNNGVNGFLVPVKEVLPLANAIETLLLNKELRIKMGKEGRKIAEKNFSIETVVEKTFQIYEQ